MKLSPTNQLIIAAVVIVALAAAMFFLLIFPTFGQMATIDSQILQEQQAVQAAKTLVAQRTQAKNAAAKTQADALKLANELPDNPELPSLVIELQDMANEAGLDFFTITPQAPKTGTTGTQGSTASAGYTIIPVTILLDGEWADVIDFLRRMEDSTRQIRVAGVKIGPDAQKNGVLNSTEPTTATGPEKIILGNEFSIEAYTLQQTAPSKGAAPPPPAGAAAPAAPKQ
jgi:Tfp pilus assembly protein PilO